MPPFLLLMPSYNQARYVEPAVRSILAQDDPDWELWIVDNSSDNTPQVMAQFQDPRIRFHHIPARMDPGSCLNWMLERAQGRDFSYVHTDNNLGPSYVRAMRAALAADPLSLAYCDMRTIDEHGARTQVLRRGAFSLARLVSLRPLGVPFSATTELARKLGGFSARDAADDVHFCTRAWGLGPHVYLREPLIEYRVHSGSRTTDFGGDAGIHRAFLKSHARSVRDLEARGLRPLEALATEIREILDDLDWLVEDVWYRYLARHGARWRSGPIDLEAFFRGGLIRLPCDAPSGTTWLDAPFPRRPYDGSASTWVHLLRTRVKLRQELRRRGSQLRDVVVPWAYLTLDAPEKPVALGIDGDDMRTRWCAALLERNLGWTAGPRDQGAPLHVGAALRLGRAAGAAV